VGGYIGVTARIAKEEDVKKSSRVTTSSRTILDRKKRYRFGRTTNYGKKRRGKKIRGGTGGRLWE